MTRSAPSHKPMLSVVVPCFNEEACLPAFVERMVQACQKGADGSYEIILVNDGSVDSTWPCIKAMALTKPGVIGINLARNHGHQLAVSAGLAQTRGERILVIDADLQDPPELLGAMMRMMDQGYDVVYGRRRIRIGESHFKRVSAHFFYRALGRISNIDIPMDTGDFRLMSRRIVDRLAQMPEQDRFLRGMIAWLGGKQGEVLYDRDVRYAGHTGYSLAKMLRLATAGLTSFSTVPLRLAAVFTGISMLIGIGVSVSAVYAYLLGHVVPGWTSLIVIMSFFSTAQLACLAILSIYVGRIFMQVKQRPLFLIDSVVTNDAQIGLAPPHPTVLPLGEQTRAAG